MTTPLPRCRLAFLSGGLSGRVHPIPPGPVRLGRSSTGEIVLPASDQTVSGRHALFCDGEDGTVLSDAGSRSGTFRNGRRLAPGEAVPITRGDLLLFGAGGAAALVLSGDEAPPRSWVVVESEAVPGAGAAATDVGEWSVALDAAGRPVAPPPPGAKDAWRFRLDREPPRAVPLAGGEGAAAVSGDVLRAGPGRPGLRVLGIRGEPGSPAVGAETIEQAVGRALRRRGPWRALAGIAAAIVVAGLFLGYREIRRGIDEDRYRGRLEAERLAREVEAVRGRFEKSFAEQRADFDAALARQQEEMRRQLAGVKENERERFAVWLEKYRRSVFLLYVTAEISGASLARPVRMAGYGTGFAVSADGLVVTNKHVVEFRKFEPEVAAFLERHPDTRISTVIHAWPAGERFLDASGNPPNPETGYSSGGRGNLRLVATAPDDWVEVTVDLGGEQVRTKVHGPTDHDLAILRLSGGAFTPLPVCPDPAALRELDPVMLLGFPLGGRVLDSGRSDLSASLGTVRFVSGVVAHTASAFQGNSGGPLLSIDGEVVGVLTRGPVKGPGGEVAESFTQAIRSDALLRFLETVR